jgi:hypothetical protein
MVHTKYRPARRITTEYIEIGTDGVLFVKKGYQYDGPSGPSVDTHNFMRGALFHDALYQLIDEGELTKSDRKRADRLLYEICRADGMSWFRASYVYRTVRIFGGFFIKRKNKTA